MITFYVQGRDGFGNLVGYYVSADNAEDAIEKANMRLSSRGGFALSAPECRSLFRSLVKWEVTV